MPDDLQAVADPRLILLALAGGLALVGAYVTRSRIVGSGFTWLIAGVAVLAGIGGALSEGAWWARIGLVALIAASVRAGRPLMAALLLAFGGVCFAVEASITGGLLPTATATLALGGVTGEMLLGHWYLVDPRLPRRALRTLAIVGGIGLVADGVVLAAIGNIPVASGAGIAFLALLATSVILMAGVVAAIRYPAYSGVMAATGLSYLAILTSVGAVFVGRALVAGIGPFAS